MKKILIVDDERPITSMFCDSFALESDYQVASAHEGAEAIQKIKECLPSLIVLDWRLKGAVEGRDVLLFAKKEFSKVPVFVVTGSIHLAKEIEALGADLCLAKPCHDLKTIIKRKLD